ncbi:MAG: alanine racemase, partial [Gaiellales bacterium]|nr:alanine racemase [Gaiellales bacterium]
MTRSTLEVDLGAVRSNVRRLIRVAAGSEVWAVVKADGYGHGAIECAGAALMAGAARV